MLAAWRRLIEPQAALSDPERRRARVLSVIILLLLFSAALYLATLFFTTEPELWGPYTLLIGGFLVLFSFAFSLNRTGHYAAAAGLLVACTVLGPWSAIFLNFSALNSDVMRLSYIAVSILLSSILFPPRLTVILAALQVAAMWLISLSAPSLTSTTWPSLLGFVIFMSLLSIVSSFISRRDMEQIDRQTRQLLESEARLRELSIRDPLTGLYNRRYLDETLDRELSRVARKRLPLGVIMLDIDHFKQFNDTHSHAAGDALLQQVGRCLLASVRAGDIACRYGGEEFLLVLPEASLEVTSQRAEHVRRAGRRLHVEFQGTQLEAVTFSLGVAAFPLHGETGTAVLGAADAALYEAKRAGRDRAVVAST